MTAEAKGRVERLWGTLQDRLVSELRLAGARTVEQANADTIIVADGFSCREQVEQLGHRKARHFAEVLADRAKE